MELLGIYAATQRKDGVPYVGESHYPFIDAWSADSTNHSEVGFIYVRQSFFLILFQCYLISSKFGAARAGLTCARLACKCTYLEVTPDRQT